MKLVQGLVLLLWYLSCDGSAAAALLLKSGRTGVSAGGGVKSEATAVQDPFTSRAFALQRGEEQVRIAKGARELAKVSLKAIDDKRQEYSAALAEEAAEDVAQKAVSEQEVEDLGRKIEAYTEEAQKHDAHVRSMINIDAAKQLMAAASKAAVNEVEQELIAEAGAAARNATVKVETTAEHATRVAALAAEAAKPYHLGLLRAQYGARDSYNSAKEAYTEASQLALKARQLAADAQTMQAEGNGMKARLMMTQAHDIFFHAQDMQKWVHKLYKRASDMEASTAWYQRSMFEAARHAAATAPATPDGAVFPPPPA